MYICKLLKVHNNENKNINTKHKCKVKVLLGFLQFY